MMEYKKTPLKEVIVRIDFDKISINKTNNFSKIVKNYFPNESFREINEKVIKIKNDDKGIKDSKVENVSRFEYIYTTNNNENSVKLTRNTLLIHYLEYKNHAELYKHIEILNSLIKEFNIKTINRLGLRYYNLIENLDLEKKYINKDFFSNIKFLNNQGENISRMMGNTVLKYDNCNMTINHGFWNKDFPSKIRKWDYIMDFDCSSSIPLSTKEDDILDNVKKVHTHIINGFELLITEKYKKYLNK